MKTKIKILLLFIALLLVMACIPNKVLAATYGNLTYQIDSTTKELSISDCDENATSATIPSSINNRKVTKIDSYAFSDCSKLSTVTIPSSINEIGGGAFENCIGLTNITIPNSVTEIENYTFDGCSNLSTIKLPTNLKAIGDGAFRGCKKLRDFAIPNGVKTIGRSAFSDCENIPNIVVPSSVTYCASAFNSCKGLISLIINGPIHSVDDFNDCPKLKTVKLPNTVAYIEAYAFNGCTSLEEITIPASVLQVKLGAFGNCTSLKKVTFLGDKTSFSGTYIFGSTPPDMTLYVLRDSEPETYAINNNLNYKYITIPMNICNISGISNKEYTGKNLTQNPTIKYEASILKNGKDYTLSYSNNKNIGKATIKITGKGRYSGSVTKSFNVLPKKVTGVANKTQNTNSITIKWNKVAGANGYEVYKYEASKKKYIKIKQTSSTSFKVSKLKLGTIYKFKVRAYKTVGSTKYYGSYSSVKSLTTQTKTPSISKVTAGNKKMTVKYKRVSGASGYQIQYSTNSKFKSKNKTTNTSSLTKTINGLKSKSKYYVRIRTYKTVNGSRVYSSWSKARNVKIK